MKKYMTLAILMAITATAAYGTPESKALVELKIRVHEQESQGDMKRRGGSGASPQIETKRKVYADLDVHQYAQVGTDESFKLVPTLRSLDTKYGGFVRVQDFAKPKVSTSRNNLVAVVPENGSRQGSCDLVVHDMLGSVIYACVNANNVYITQAALNEAGTHVVYATIAGPRGIEIGIVDLATKKFIASKVFNDLASIAALAISDDFQHIAVLGTLANPQEGNTAKLYVLDHRLEPTATNMLFMDAHDGALQLVPMETIS